MKFLISSLVTIATLLFSCEGANAQDVYAGGYLRRDGTYVEPYYRTPPDGYFYNNFSTYPNVTPYTGKIGTRHNPPGLGETDSTNNGIQGIGFQDDPNGNLFATGMAAMQQQQQDKFQQALAARQDAERQISSQQEMELRAKSLQLAQEQLSAQNQKSTPTSGTYFSKAEQAPQQSVADTTRSTPTVVPDYHNQVPAPSPGRVRDDVTLIADAPSNATPPLVQEKRQYVRSLWPGMQHHVTVQDANAMVAAANDPTVSLADLHSLWQTIEQRSEQREGGTTKNDPSESSHP